MPEITDEELFDCEILVVDDNLVNVTLLQRLLLKSGYRNVRAETSPIVAEQICLTSPPDLLILDLHMPQRDGYQVLENLYNGRKDSQYLPILVFSADITPEARRRALSLGASDFLTKPGDALEICLRVRNFLSMGRLYRRMVEHASELEGKVEERTRSLMEAQIEIVERLAMVGDYRDDQTGDHCRRVAEMSFNLAIELKLPETEAELIRLAAPLHDIGKVGISDALIRKPDKLTPEEFDEIRTHTTIGGNILGGSRSELLRMAHTIAMSHHERWDGRGYPLGLKGEEIPLPGRIVAVADVFDALTNSRPYKRAWSVESAMTEIIRCSGTQFDPRIVDALSRLANYEILESAA